MLKVLKPPFRKADGETRTFVGGQGTALSAGLVNYRTAGLSNPLAEAGEKYLGGLSGEHYAFERYFKSGSGVAFAAASTYDSCEAPWTRAVEWWS